MSFEGLYRRPLAALTAAGAEEGRAEGSTAPNPPQAPAPARSGLQAAGLGAVASRPPRRPGSHGRLRAVAAEETSGSRLQQRGDGGGRAAFPAGEADGAAAGGGRPVRRRAGRGWGERGGSAAGPSLGL